MAFVLSDRIKETTTTTGTGTYTLGGAVSGFETFTANLSNSDTTYYCCTDGTDFEVGLGTFASSGTTLARTTIISSSNSNNAVNWSSGSRDIFCTLPGSKAVFKDGSDNINGTFVGNITGNVTGNTSGTAATVTGAAQSNITSVGTLTGLTTSGSINLSQTSGTAIKTSGNLNSSDLNVLRASANPSNGADTHGFSIRYKGSGTGNNNAYALIMDNQAGTDVEAMTVLQDGKVGINNTSPSAPLDVSGNAEITGTLTAGEVSATTLDIGGTNITATATEINKLDGVTATTTELNYVDVTTLGTVQASKAVTADANGDVLFPDNEKAKFGTGGDLEIYHDGSNSYINDTGTGQLLLRTTGDFVQIQTDADVMGKFIKDGAVELYHNNVKKFQTTAQGFGYFTSDVTMEFSDQSNNGVVEIGGSAGALIDLKSPRTDDFDFRLQVNTSNTAFVISDDLHLQSRTGAEDYLDATVNGAVNLYYDNVKKFETTSTGATVTGDLLIQKDDDGASQDPSIVIYRNSSSPADNDFTGDILFRANNDNSEVIDYAQIHTKITDASDSSEGGYLEFKVMQGGSLDIYAQMAFNNLYVFKQLTMFNTLYMHNGQIIKFEGATGNAHETTLTVTDPTADRTVTLPDATGTVLTTGNSDTPTTTTSSSDADFVLVDDGGTMKKITPSNLGITSGGASKGFAVAMAIAL